MTWTIPENTLLVEESTFSPHLIAASADDMARHVIVWTGTDGLLNLRDTDSFPQWPVAGTKTTFGDSALGAPALGYTGPSGHVLLAWTGTDKNHHLNAAIALVPTAADCTPESGVSNVSSDLITHGNTSRKEVALTFDVPRHRGRQREQPHPDAACARRRQHVVPDGNLVAGARGAGAAGGEGWQ